MNTDHKKTVTPLTYKEAGVDIDAGNTLVEKIKTVCKATARPGSDAKLGGFGAFFDLAQIQYKDPLLVSTTDGVGTKLKIAQQVNKHDTVGIDLVAMCANDLLVQGAEPLFFLDYFASGKLHVDQAADVIKGIAHGCKQAGCSLSGGETAEMPGMYQPGEYDLAGFAVGIVERNKALPQINTIQKGDVIIGIASSGLHSNGFSLVRHLIKKNNLDLHGKPPFSSPHPFLYQALLEPTIIYVKSVLPLAQASYIKALAHITGGGLLENIPRVLPHDVCATLHTQAWPVPPIFNWIATTGTIAPTEMLRTFNMGIGMIAVVDPQNVTHVQDVLGQHGQTAYRIGTIQPLNNAEQKVCIV